MGFKTSKEKALKYTQEEYENYILENFNFETTTTKLTITGLKKN